MILINWNELWPVVNILNECCHGLYVHNFEDVIGAQRKVVVDWMDEVSGKEREGDVMLILGDFELNFLQKSFEEVFKQIEDWEFSTRIGISIEEGVVA